jgi:hypothetical protein
MAGCSSGSVLGSGASSAPVNKVLMAKLAGLDGAAQGYVAYDDEGAHQEFTVEVSGGEPGATLEITMNGAVVLSITLDEFGNAHLEFDNSPDDPGESPLPSEFPPVGEGDAVAVGDLSGNLEEEEDSDSDDDGDDEDGEDDDDGDGDVEEGDDDDDDDAGDDSDDAADDTDDDVADNDDDANDNDDGGDVEDADDGQTEDNDNTIVPASGRDET